MTSHHLEHAGCWFLHSGIQESTGGVARYYRSDLGRNAPVSTEITGYSVSFLVYWHRLTGEPAYLAAALRAACYLTREAWDPASSTIPFEPGSPHAYFFDLGIIARGLISAWRATGDTEFLDRAREAALSMAFDFLGDGAFHPILALPEKQPLAYDSRWSRRPGCYQLKSALAWRELDDPDSRRLFDNARELALAAESSFLPGDPDPEKVMDRLHAYCYFLEALLAAPDRGVLACGIERVAALLREIAPRFERSDVCAQLLRVRLYAHHAGLVPLDESAAAQEAARAARYQRPDGGFWFGSKGAAMLPFINPVSTAFCAQALSMWHSRQPLPLDALI